MNLKKAGIILFLAGLTLAVAATAYGPWFAGDRLVGVGLAVLGVVLLAVGMFRYGPRDEELPTADARRR